MTAAPTPVQRRFLRGLASHGGPMIIRPVAHNEIIIARG